jgi:hypothetical protein
MRTNSNRALAKMLGVSETAVRRAEASGRIAREADGSWDLDRVRAQWRSNTDQAQQRRSPAGLRPVPEAAVGAVRQTLHEQGLAAGGGMTFLQARTANEVLKAQERRLRVAKLKGELVDRARTTTTLFRLAREERDAWTTWPARVSALMAAELGTGAHAMQTVLERHVREQLALLAEPKLDV